MRPSGAVVALAAISISCLSLSRLLAQRRARASAPDGQGQGPTNPTFTKDIAPLFYQQCAACHRPGGPAPFSLLTYQDARDHAGPIGAATAARRMPPWLPEPGYGRFANERRLSEAQIALIRRWVESGAPEGGPADAPPAPAFPDGWQLGQPDLIVTFPAYPVPEQGSDRYRNLVASLPLSEQRYVTAVEIRPGNARVVHHARLMVDTTAFSREQDARDPEPGFDGMDVMGGPASPDGFFVGWTPGKVPARGPEDMGWRIKPGTDLVLQLHLRPRGDPEVVEPLVGLYFAPRPPARVPALVMFNWKAIDIPPGKSDYVVTDSYTLPVEVVALGVYPHAHYLATLMDASARLPDGKVQRLLRIKAWDFNWQDEYRYAEPVTLPPGSTITMRYLYDNSAGNPRNPNRPPRRVTYGPMSTDEMGDLVLQVLPRTPADREVLTRDLAWKYRSQDAAWYADRQLALGSLLALQGQYDSALAHFRAALANRSDAGVHAVLAGALASEGDLVQALPHARVALQLGPHDPLGLAVLARIVAQHPDPAIRSAKQALDLLERADRALTADDAVTLEAIAAGYAAAGARRAAEGRAERAVAAAARTGNDDLTAALRRRLEQYRAMHF